MILKLPHSSLQLQVLLYILKRFADDLADRYSFMVKKFLPTLAWTAVPRTWNLESGNYIKSSSWETLRWRFVSRGFIGECAGDQHLWGVREARLGKRRRWTVIPWQQPFLQGSLELGWTSSIICKGDKGTRPLYLAVTSMGRGLLCGQLPFVPRGMWAPSHQSWKQLGNECFAQNVQTGDTEHLVGPS